MRPGSDIHSWLMLSALTSCFHLHPIIGFILWMSDLPARIRVQHVYFVLFTTEPPPQHLLWCLVSVPQRLSVFHLGSTLLTSSSLSIAMKRHYAQSNL